MRRSKDWRNTFFALQYLEQLMEKALWEIFEDLTFGFISVMKDSATMAPALF